MKIRKVRALGVLLVGVVLAAGLVACGSDDSDSGSDDGGGSSESRVIGVAAITLASPNVLTQIDTIERAAELLGWEVQVLDANGDPSKMAANVSAFVNQDVDAILNIAIPPELAAEGMKAAKEKDIPIIAIAAPLDDPQGYLAATYAPDDAGMSDLLVAQMKKDLPALGGSAEALSLNAAGIKAIVIRQETLAAGVKGTKITVGANHETDLANAVQDTQQAVSNALRANTKINMIWGLQDFEFVTSFQTIESQNLQEAAIYSYYPPAEALQILRDWEEGDAPLAIADSPIEFVPWYAFDALVNKWILEESDWVTSMDIKPLPLSLVTPADVPEGDSIPYEPFEPFFIDRWEGEGVELNT